MSVTTTITTADCELLGRGPVQGSADSDSLATLVRQLCKKQQQRGRLPGRRCTVACSRDAGLEIIPYQRKRPDDEGFESDEDLASLGSYDDPAKRKTGTLAAVSAAAGAASDSANSSGVSEDSDDADAASLRGEQAPVTVATETADGSGREAYGLTDVAFCHTDAAALPGIAVWVIKTRRTPSAGLEAIVVRSRDNRLQDVCRAYQEHSRRMKLEPKPWVGHTNGAGGPLSSQRRKVGVSGGSISGNIALTAMPEVNRFNLVQRTDTDGVTHIEVTAGPVVAAANSTSRDSSQSNIISISTPESPRPTTKDRSYGDDNQDRDDGDGGIEPPPQRPERRKYKVKPDDGDGSNEDYRRQQKVVRGQFIRVNVNHCAVLPPASPEPERKSGQDSAAKSPAAQSPTTVISDRLWSTADYDRLDGRYEQHRQSSRSSSRTRSRSTGPGRRQQQPLQLAAVQPSHPPPVAFSRYPNNEQQQPSSFGNRFFGKLREITSGNQSPPLQDLQPVAFRRRNSVGESVTANFYQYFSHQHHHQHHQLGQYQQQQQQQQQLYQQQLHQQHRQQAKNGGHLKSVIKKNNKSQLYQHTYDEPKKVTFSAYATVQVVD
ncbi:uncharacterized protein LOC100574642 [Acyrthosiphon pisum]|uniref:Uncharacterized protein n=1 Tax=Acyrthosiphon pisum TaxID=7029 RepID=A0A8R2AAZ1_ACYPI|nr:uncharacterized protein LOC100574642 [Acyrthosiphon pisum]|eukprot:XP_003241830.1 PREDICTED: uncharacterized protein LOC100574642 [Acyrthosiphon pisum]